MKKRHRDTGFGEAGTPKTLSFNFSASRAYLICAAAYEHREWALRTPEKDAAALGNLLEQQQFRTAQLKNPTLAEMRDFLERIKKENTAESTRVLIYFAGHGMQRDSAQGLKGYFLPIDAKPGDEATMLPMEEMQAMVDQLKARHVLVILDCCFAGAFQLMQQRSTLRVSETMSRQYYDMFTQYPARKVLTSTSYRQKAFDRIETTDEHSPFVQILLQGLQGAADGKNGDRLITLPELVVYLQNNLTQRTKTAGQQQSVGFGSLPQDGDGEFIFFLDDPARIRLEEMHYENPYKGLQSYEPGDAAVFFGREEAARQLHEKVLAHPFVVVTGASGTGKSSLVKAGLLPRLSGKRCMVIRPGKKPLQALPSGDAEWDLLVIDQFEEIVTQSVPPPTVAAFYQKIAEWVRAGQKRIVLTVRSDFEAQVRHALPDDVWKAGRFLVPAFSPEEYHAIIVQPARRVACLFEDDKLVEEIEKEVNGEPGPLPLLSFLLESLFEKAKARHSRIRTILRKEYADLGGLSGALIGRAEEVWQALEQHPQGQQMLRAIMLRMVSLTTGERSRRPVFLDELNFGPSQKTLVLQVVTRLSDARLIRNTTFNTEQATSAKGGKWVATDTRPYIEPAHDALVRSWWRLWEWIKDMGEENQLICHKIIGAAADWIAAPEAEQKGRLWPGDTRVDIAFRLNWTPENPSGFQFSTTELAFLEASRTEKAEQIHRLKLERDKAIAMQLKAEAETRRVYANDLAFKSQVALRDGDRNMAFRLAEFAERYADSGNEKALQGMINALYYNDNAAAPPLPRVSSLSGHLDDVNDVTFSPDGKLLASGSSDTTAKIWDADTGICLLTLKGHKAKVTCVAISPNGSMLATGSLDKTVRLWDLHSGELLKTLKRHRDGISKIDFSPDSKKLATVAGNGETDAMAIIWDLEKGKPEFVLNGHEDSVNSVDFAPNGQYLATGSNDGAAIIWDLNLKKPAITVRHTRVVCCVEFSPDSTLIATGSEDNSVRIGDIKTGELLHTYDFGGSKISGLSFSPVKKQIAVSSYDGTVKIWALSNEKLVTTLLGHYGSVTGVKFSPDGTTLATSGTFDKTIKTWKTGSENAVAILSGGLAEEHELAHVNFVFSADGKYLVAGVSDGTISVWDYLSKQIVKSFKGHSRMINCIAHSPAQAIYATTSKGEVKIWRIEHDKPVAVFSDSDNIIMNVSFSPDGKNLTIVSTDSMIKTWDWESQTITQTIDMKEPGIHRITFSTDGHLMGGICTDNVLKIWDLTDKKDIILSIRHDSSVGSISFSPDKKLLAIGYFDHTVKIWGLEEKTLLYSLIGHTDSVTAVAFSPDGKRLAARASDKKVKIWDLETRESVIEINCFSEGSSIHTIKFSPDGKNLCAGLTDKTIQIWEISGEGLLQAWKEKEGVSGLAMPYLIVNKLESLLDLHPGNEQKLIDSCETWQIKAFADLAALQAEGSNLPDQVTPQYARASRLYAAALALQDEALIRIDYANMLSQWAKVYRANNKMAEARALIDKAKKIWPAVKPAR